MHENEIDYIAISAHIGLQSNLSHKKILPIHSLSNQAFIYNIKNTKLNYLNIAQNLNIPRM